MAILYILSCYAVVVVDRGRRAMCRWWLHRRSAMNKKKKKPRLSRAAVTGRELLGNYTVDPVVVVSIHRPREHRDRVASVLVLVVYSFFFFDFSP